MLSGNVDTAEPGAPQVLPAESRNLIALAAAIAHRRKTSAIETCVRHALASGATSDAVMQVVSLATQMAEVPAARYVRAARRGIEAFRAADLESPT
jgi:alkylhydroperoxidase/carboxymuconolactone decarboxylase family protein YurZ